jgi:hypothetical protein
MDLAPLVYIIRGTERHLLFLIHGLLLVIPVISVVSVIFVIFSVSRVDFPIILLLYRGPLAIRLKKSSLGFGSLNAYVSDYEQIDHRSGLLHGDLLHSLDVTDSVVKSIDDFSILDIRDDIPDVAETFHVVLEAIIMLLLDGLQSLSSRWTLVCALKVLDEYGT